MKTLFRNIIFWIIQLEAKIVLKKYKPRIIAVTGSVGKTTTKEAIYNALSQVLYIGKNEKSYNSEIGIPLTILELKSSWGGTFRPLWHWFKNITEGLLLIVLPNIYPRWLILEAGVDHPGDMNLINKWIKSDVAVFTKFPQTPVHVEYFSSPEEVINEKKKLTKSLKKEGVLILNADDEEVLKIKEGSGKRAVTFGFDKKADVVASNLEIFYKDKRPAGINFKVKVNGNSLPIILEGVLGIQHVYPVLASIAVGRALDLNVLKLVEGFRNREQIPGRMRILDGAFGSTIIDDTYNSSPVAVIEALNTLEQIRCPRSDLGQSGRKIVVLGDMMELGEHMKEEHQKVGEYVAGKADILVAVGERAQHIAESAEKAEFSGEIYRMKNSAEAGDFLKDFLRDGDVILVKGSQSPRLEKIVEKILARPEEARFLLVRQEKEWQRS